MKIAVYPGSFDPFTIGHLDVLKSAAELFDEVYVAVLNNSAKSPVFTVEERVEMIDRILESEGFRNVRSGSFGGLLVDYAKQIGAQYIIRGLRAITDFEYEFQIDAVNRHLDPKIRTVYFMANPAHSFLSSSNVREIGEMGGSIEGLVPHCNYHYLRERLARQK
ncbi:MAG: pantetheine-phosphate adenylyltransferase [Clostridia bacterium]|nr:pantetheine-phosphate adenylyltransferase [Clostridia bacterium]